jgi:hypothetical protein
MGIVVLLPLIFLSFVFQKAEPWTSNQLVEPADLAATLTDANKTQPLVICVGPGAMIKNSREMGSASDKENLKKLELYLNSLQRDTGIVIYCGCCPFDKCPNIRPAFSLLNDMGFKNHKLLNLPHNVKMDWIDHGYPISN